MYELSLAGAIFGVGLALWFRPVMGLLLFQRYRGPPESRLQRRLRERIVALLAAGCIVASSATATLVTMWYPTA